MKCNSTFYSARQPPSLTTLLTTLPAGPVLVMWFIIRFWCLIWHSATGIFLLLLFAYAQFHWKKFFIFVSRMKLAALRTSHDLTLTFPLYTVLHRHFTVVARCENLILLNVTKTEMAVGFRRTRGSFNTISILGEEVEVVESYKYLFTLATDWAGSVLYIYFYYYCLLLQYYYELRQNHSNMNQTQHHIQNCCIILQSAFLSSPSQWGI